MTDTEIVLKFNDGEHAIMDLRKRIEAVEEQHEIINRLAGSVADLARSMKSMLLEQEKQSNRIICLEERPYKAWLKQKQIFITAVVSAIGGAGALKIITLLSSIM